MMNELIKTAKTEIKSACITTIKPGGKVGIKIDKEIYEEIKEFILQLVRSEGYLTINELISKAFEKFKSVLKAETNWFIYNIKLDLEARGLIENKHKGNDLKRTVISQSYINESKKVSSSNTKRSHSVKPEINKALRNKFYELFSRNGIEVYAPGRINLIGEHTDYNNGFVLPVAIDKGIRFAIAESKNSSSLVYSLKYKEFLSIDLNNLKKIYGTVWQNYLLGILEQLKRKGHKIRPFDCVFDSDLPSGAGLSSSAALECGFVLALKSLFNLNLSKMEMTHISQWAEHNYVGVQCGIMDQFTSIMGKHNHAVLLDCQTLKYEYVPLDLGKYCFLLCDTNVKHSLASSEYNMRRQECEEGIDIIHTKFPEVRSLRDATLQMLNHCSPSMPVNIYNRCRYVVEENQRVIQACNALKRGKIESLGEKMYESHDGLSELYNVSCPELDFLVNFTKQFSEVLGSRMMGGGFGGCTLNVIESSFVGTFISQVMPAYKEEFNHKLDYYVVRTADGASILERED